MKLSAPCINSSKERSDDGQQDPVYSKIANVSIRSYVLIGILTQIVGGRKICFPALDDTSH